MITMLNRKELAVTFSLEEQAAIRTKLQDQGIDYTIKTVNRNSPSPISQERAYRGTFGQDPNLDCQYIIYVHKEDFEKASYCIRK